MKTIKEEKKVPFRSILSLNGYSDEEYFEPDTSETEEGQDVDIRTVYERCLRGEFPDILSGEYDIKGDMSVDEAFDTLDLTQSEGFDLADATMIANSLSAKLSKGEEIAVTEQGAANSKASDERVLEAGSDASEVLEK